MEKSLQPEDVAIKRLNSAISEYRRLCLKNHLLYTTCKSLAIILAAMIP